MIKHKAPIIMSQFSIRPAMNSFNRTKKLLSSAPPFFNLRKESRAMMPMDE
jgi:hypothetical protein